LISDEPVAVGKVIRNGTPREVAGRLCRGIGRVCVTLANPPKEPRWPEKTGRNPPRCCPNAHNGASRPAITIALATRLRIGSFYQNLEVKFFSFGGWQPAGGGPTLAGSDPLPRRPLSVFRRSSSWESIGTLATPVPKPPGSVRRLTDSTPPSSPCAIKRVESMKGR
jgi:hypothetical protein